LPAAAAASWLASTSLKIFDTCVSKQAGTGCRYYQQ
jgi:hypothetical protein